MEASSYDAVWLTEHHFNDYSVCPSIPVMGAYVAARTKRLRIGTGVTLAAYYHPLRLAEEIALLDILSEGRVYWGAGRGFDPIEFKAFGMSAEESYPRFREAVDIVIKAWTDKQITYQGQYHSFENVEVLPKPLQTPHPPVWVAAASPAAIEWAAERGYSIMLDPHSPASLIAEKVNLWRQLMAGKGFSSSGRVIPTVRLVAIAAIAAEAAAVALEGVKWLLRTYINPWLLQTYVNPSLVNEDTATMLKHYVESVVIHGTPDMVTEKLSRLREGIGLDYVIAAPLSHQTFVLLTERVLPNLADR
jgi:alkanesulfonate monooxygenase SsuD/methylene tetrahydromethanopterin reductase-like flavin-dependent oxidoreductase (luciferase family)